MALRFWDLATRPGWQYDEGVYTGVARNLLQHGRLTEHVTYGTPWSPFLYQPPFYFNVLARWFAVFGPSIYHARILGVLCSLATLSLLFTLLWRLHGPRAALLASAPIILDGWLLYIQRISYIENMLLLLITAGMLLYQVALDKGKWQWFAVAGVVARVRRSVQVHRGLRHRRGPAVLADPAHPAPEAPVLLGTASAPSPSTCW